jgi:peptide subunit release factor 1 (eRF1)
MKEVMALEKQLNKEEEEKLITHFDSELKKGGLASSGLNDTLRSLNRGEVQTLLVTRGFSKPGRFCPKCGFLFVEETKCPACRVKTENTVDIIDEAVEAAFDKNCRVRHVNPPSLLRRYGNIGAVLRYKS